MKLNTKNFLDMTFLGNTWYKIDVLLSWEEQKAALYVDSEYVTTTSFYIGRLPKAQNTV